MCVYIVRLANLPISCDTILMWIDFVMPFDVGGKQCGDIKLQRNANTSVKLPFYLAQCKEYCIDPMGEVRVHAVDEL